MLGKRVIEPRRVVLTHDPAVDTDASDLDAYRESLYDVSKLEFKDGAQATIWTIQGMTRRQRRVANRLLESAQDGAPGQMERTAEWADHVVACGLLAVDGYYLASAGGQHSAPPNVVRASRDGMGEMVTEQWMESADIHTVDLLALAQMITVLSEARPFS